MKSPIDGPSDARAPGQSAAPPAKPTGRARLAPGTVLDGKYRIDSVLGEGGMAVVYGGAHVKLGEPVAIKVLHEELTQSKASVARFVREARAAARVRSEHGATILDVDTLASGEPYIVMELLRGEDLGQRLDRSGKLPTWEAVDLVVQACQAVQAAHAAGIVHRDIKPSNIFLCSRADGSTLVKVVDFGISKVPKSNNEESLTLTHGESFLGSPRYMAPEQMLHASDVDARADIWSLACTLYRALTGVPPFDGDNVAQICGAVLSSTPVLASAREPGVPAGLAQAIATALSKDREARPADVRSFVAAIEAFRAAPKPGLDPMARTIPLEPSAPPASARVAPRPAAAKTYDTDDAPTRMLMVPTQAAATPAGAIAEPTRRDRTEQTLDGVHGARVDRPSRRWLLAVGVAAVVVPIASVVYLRQRAEGEPRVDSGSAASGSAATSGATAIASAAATPAAADATPVSSSAGAVDSATPSAPASAATSAAISASSAPSATSPQQTLTARPPPTAKPPPSGDPFQWHQK